MGPNYFKMSFLFLWNQYFTVYPIYSLIKYEGFEFNAVKIPQQLDIFNQVEKNLKRNTSKSQCTIFKRYHILLPF